MNQSGKRRRWLCVLCAVALLMLAMPNVSAAQQDDGMIRVLLTRLKWTDRADVYVAGSYSVDGNTGFTFMRGSKLVFQARDGGVTLRYEGMTLHFTGSVTLTRHPLSDALSGSENGLRFEENGALYEGDLTLSNENGTLRPVLTIHAEDYVKGVVPYEMGDSFPLESLKAQAVAARSYALNQRDSAQPYDVEDNTNDQVYRGLNAYSPLSVRACEETRGLVGAYHGQIAVCFYTASNGGTTALAHDVWSSKQGDFSYLHIKADPYDIENPLSVVRSVALNKDGSLPDALNALVLARTADELAARELNAATASVAALSAVSVEYDQNGQPQLVMTVDIRADVMERATEIKPNEDAFVRFSETMRFDYFRELEGLLSLSINGGQNECVSVSENENMFVLRARRYGHGVGMSQRGAEWMAKQYGMSCADILAFYYPGLEFVTMEYASSARKPLAEETQGTPAPAASPTPRPTLMPLQTSAQEGQYFASVSLSDVGSTLNLRAEPTTASSVLYRLYHGQRLLVVKECLDGWVQVKTDVVEGYVMSVYLKNEP